MDTPIPDRTAASDSGPVSRAAPSIIQEPSKNTAKALFFVARVSLISYKARTRMGLKAVFLLGFGANTGIAPAIVFPVRAWILGLFSFKAAGTGARTTRSTEAPAQKRAETSRKAMAASGGLNRPLKNGLLEKPGPVRARRAPAQPVTSTLNGKPQPGRKQ